MFQHLTTLQFSGRKKIRWSLSTEDEQMELWELEQQILNQVICTIIFMRLKNIVFERIVKRWKPAA
jgi:hypothetical protein